MKFRAVVLLGGKTATGIQVPDEVVDALNAGKRPAVCITIGSHTYRTTVSTRHDMYLVPLSAEHRTAAGVAAGDEVEVSIVVDDAPRDVELPDDLAAALAAHGDARAAFDRLSFTHRKEYARWVTEAKKAETRPTRIDRCVEQVSTGKLR
jgi:hypothetical protein